MEGTQVTDIEKKVEYPQFKKGFNISNQLKEDEVKATHPNCHIETYYVLYDEYGPIGEYKTEEEAKQVQKEWYIDPELYPDGDPKFHIEKEDYEVSNKVIHVKDDLV